MSIFIFFHIFLSVILIVSGILKLLSLQSFHKTLMELNISKCLSNILKIAVPITEVLAGIIILIGPLQLYGQIMILMLLVGFSYAALKVQKTSNKVNCNCFGDLVPSKFGYNTWIHIMLIFILNGAILKNLNHFSIHIPMADLITTVFLSLGILSAYAMTVSYSEYVNKGQKD